MSGLYLKENYDAVIEALNGQTFYIFGNTYFAHTFYMHCREKMSIKT